MIITMYGGDSVEHDISIITACLFARSDYKNVYVEVNGQWNYLDKPISPAQHKGIKGKKCVVLPNDKCLYAVKNSRLSKLGEIDCVLTCFHGGNGEGGGIQGLLELSGIPYTSCGVTASALCLDKIACKHYLCGLGLPTVEGQALSHDEYVKGGLPNLNYPVVVKPSRLGSSIGVTLATNSEQLNRALTLAFSLDDRVLLERYVGDVTEMNCAALDNYGAIEISNTEISSSGGIFTFDKKYKSSQKKFSRARQPQDNEITRQIKKYTEIIANNLDIGGVIRVDYFVQGDKVLVNEINTIPGNLAYHLFAEVYSKRQYVDLLVASAISKHNKRPKTKYLSTGVLEYNNFTKK